MDCAKVSRGCGNRYAERFVNRFRGPPGHPFENGFDLTLRPEWLSQPLAWRRSRRVFVNSMSDLFRKKVPTGFIDRVFDIMETADRRIFQVLTKHSSLMRDYLRRRYIHALRSTWMRLRGRVKVTTVRRAGIKYCHAQPPCDAPSLGGAGKTNCSHETQRLV